MLHKADHTTHTVMASCGRVKVLRQCYLDWSIIILVDLRPKQQSWAQGTSSLILTLSNTGKMLYLTQGGAIGGGNFLLTEEVGPQTPTGSMKRDKRTVSVSKLSRQPLKALCHNGLHKLTPDNTEK